MEEPPVTQQPAGGALRPHLLLQEVEEEQEVGSLPPGRWSLAGGAEPIVTQPGLGVTTTTITTISQTGGDWSSTLLDVCSDRSTCLLGAVAPCCLDVHLAHQHGECVCLPLLPGSTLALRVGLRERYKIRGSVCEDWLAVCCCYPAAVCQMSRESSWRLQLQTYRVSTVLRSS